MFFLASSTILLWRRHNRAHGAFNVPMVVANFTLFSCCTAHYALEFNHFYTTLVRAYSCQQFSNNKEITKYNIALPQEATGVPGFANETHKLVGADLLISLTDMLGDMVLIYRCYYVWGQNPYVVILPFLTAVAGFGEFHSFVSMALLSDPFLCL